MKYEIDFTESIQYQFATKKNYITNRRIASFTMTKLSLKNMRRLSQYNDSMRLFSPLK